MGRVFERLAQLVDAYHRSVAGDNHEWAERHEELAKEIVRARLPHGSGFDDGTSLDLDASSVDRLVFKTAFHHMNEHGYYDRWTYHAVTVRPSLAHGFLLSVGGRDRNDVKAYIAETFDHALREGTGDGC